MEGYGYRWYRVGGLDYLLDRSEIETDSPVKTRRRARARPSVMRAQRKQ
jgi:maltose alpha-D-glucosyltransferase/alpha-amylase